MANKAPQNNEKRQSLKLLKIKVKGPFKILTPIRLYMIEDRQFFFIRDIYVLKR